MHWADDIINFGHTNTELEERILPDFDLLSGQGSQWDRICNSGQTRQNTPGDATVYFIVLVVFISVLHPIIFLINPDLHFLISIIFIQTHSAKLESFCGRYIGWNGTVT